MAGEERGGLAGLLRRLHRRLSRAASDLAAGPVGYQPGRPDDISTQIGYDVRDLMTAGYSKRQIKRVVEGEITLAALLRSAPENKPR